MTTQRGKTLRPAFPALMDLCAIVLRDCKLGKLGNLGTRGSLAERNLLISFHSNISRVVMMGRALSI
jgi:hypothetical protein